MNQKVCDSDLLYEGVGMRVKKWPHMFIHIFFLLQAAIRKELNEFKSKEMDVHDDSKHLTR